jgi:hypothetical protein
VELVGGERGAGVHPEEAGGKEGVRRGSVFYF